jgi:hypothetical protein
VLHGREELEVRAARGPGRRAVLVAVVRDAVVENPQASNDSFPSASRRTRLVEPVPPENVPVVRSRVTPVVCRGSMSSYIEPPLAPPPASSPKRIVPHGVRRTGSHEVVPVTIVATAPVCTLARWSPGAVVPSSLQKIRYCGSWSLGHSAIWSATGADWVVTTRACSPSASVTRVVGSACAWAWVTCCDDDPVRGPFTPNSCSDRD